MCDGDFSYLPVAKTNASGHTPGFLVWTNFGVLLHLPLGDGSLLDASSNFRVSTFGKYFNEEGGLTIFCYIVLQ